MIEFKCDVPGRALLSQMIPFQGALKKRTDKDIDDLCASLLTDGLITPFILWEVSEGTFYIMDGHGRHIALTKMGTQDPAYLAEPYPAILIRAASEDEARKQLLQIVSTYGKINRPGLVAFSAPIIGYKAPIIDKVNKKIERRESLFSKETLFQIIKLRVPKDKAADVIKLLNSVDYIEVV